MSIEWRQENLGITCPQLCFFLTVIKIPNEYDEEGRVKNVLINNCIRNGCGTWNSELFQKLVSDLRLFPSLYGEGGSAAVLRVEMGALSF